jgi:hypothetical protein
MANDYDSTQGEFLRPLVTGWLAKIESALTCGPRKRWKEIADECLMFYSKSAAAMWDPFYQRKFWKNVKAPKFRITINKAFELVAVFGPNLLWDVPHRTVTPKKQLELPPDLFAHDPEQQQLMQMLSQQMQREAGQDRVVAHLMQPGGGLEGHSELAVIDALIKGRGCLWSAPYSFPSSGRQLIGSFRDKPERLLIDPDFSTMDEAQWIVRIHQDPHWALEKRFELPAGSLKGRATLESNWHYAELKGAEDGGASDRQAGKTNDLVIWYEVFSKMGVGSRMTGMPDEIKNHLDEVVGDYAYLAICPNCPFPLNCPTEKLRKGATDKEVQHLFSWPIPTWADDRWPVEVLDFYPDPESAYPIAPLAPGMGELKFLNFLVPWACNRIYTSSRDFWAVMGSQLDQFQKYLQEGEDQTVIPIPPSAGTDDIRKIVTVLQQPETRFDIWKIIELVSTLFDKRVGLTEFAYGRNEGGTQDRTAATTMERKNAVGVRPEHMQKKVVGWQSRVATMEAMLTYLFVKAKDTVPLMGQGGAMLWQRYIENADGEQIFRQMNYTVSAASIRRPNRDRDIANFQQASDKWMSAAQSFGVETGSWEPINGMMKKWGEYHDADMTECFFVPPPPDEEAAALEKAQLQAETQKMQAEAQKLTSEAQQNPAEIKAMEAQADIQIKQQEFQLDIAKTQAELQMEAQKHQMEMQQKQEEGRLSLALKAKQGEQQIQQGQQNMVMQAQQHAQQIQQGDQQHKQSLKQGEQQTQAKVQQMKAQAKAKPKPAGAAK